MDNKPTIAVVDDHDILRNEVSRILELLGFHVLLKAANGREFLDSIDYSGNIPDLCLLDINMPIMNGFDTALKIKELYPKMKVLAYSHNTNVITDILNCGADDFLFKGSSPDELKRALQQLCSTNDVR